MTSASKGMLMSPIAWLTYDRCLEFLDGERLVLLRNRAGEPFLKIWTDVVDDVTRWWYVRTTEVELNHFLFCRLSLKQVILSARDGFVYVVDIRRNGDLQNVTLEATTALPKESLPSDDSLFDSDLGFEAPRDEHTVLIDGRWQAADLSKLEKRLTDVVSFLAPFGTDVMHHKGQQETLFLKDAFTSYRYRGGWVQKLTFDRLSRVVPAEKQVELDKLFYASPGIVKFRMDPVYEGRVRLALKAFEARRLEARAAYHALHETLLALGRAEDSAERSSESVKAEIADLRSTLPALSNRLAIVLGGIDLARVQSTANDEENTGQLLAAYFRRLEELYDLEADCKRDELVDNRENALAIPELLDDDPGDP